MKAKLTIAGLMIAGSMSAQVDLAIGNIDAGWDTYNTAGQITGVYFDVLNNENGSSGAFDVMVYLVNPNNSNESYVVYTYNDANGQNGNTVVTYTDIDIDFNDTPGIPAGEYRLAVCVDPDDDITETDENNNCLYISTQGNNLVYNPSTTGLDVYNNDAVSLYPNPAQDFVSIRFNSELENYVLTVSDITGKTVKSVVLTTAQAQLNVTDLTAGIYFYQVVSADGKVVSTGKLIRK